MRLQVETNGLVQAAGNLRLLGDGARDVATALRRAPTAGLDADVDAGLRQVTGVGADAFELIAADLDVIATALVSGGAVYRVVESAAVTAAAAGGNP